ncbi:DUF5979 domain-containing protein [Tessaracoccus sp. OH4464_COT-324]|uniref:DUF5979 domain-containing protein n=1 Tax=Tessaracoccus sp. OH4464_COT-324 TaxID=2491059 RepID=UPI000F63F97A|nr:DUF5979 domain-containing protein [Tessaracoccus sp. OH4464_COT-324]RRD47861.1 hypothetical protein EII42_01030 [Tessaracoccus sp. OH4464_COT-324]
MTVRSLTLFNEYGEGNRMKQKRPSRLGSVLLSLMLFTGLLPGLTGLAVPANAAQNNNIALTIESLVRVNDQGTPTPGDLFVGDRVELKVNYDATDADPVPGDSFTVELPPEFITVEHGRPGREIVKELTFNGIHSGDCVIRAQYFTCTFNEAIRGKSGVKGAISARLQAVQETAESELPFKLNGESTMVPVPGGKGIARKETKFSPNGKISKGATGIGEQSKGINWTLNIGGAWLAKNLPGKTTFTLVDTLPNTLLEPTKVLKDITLARATPGTNGESQIVARADGSTVVDGYKIEVSALPDGLTTHLVITVPKEFNADENYQIYFPTPLTAGGTIDKGWTYTNAFRIEGVDEVTEGSKNYIESFTASIQYHEGFGIFSITKTAGGPGALDPNQEFDVLISYDMSQAAPFIRPPGWTEPANPFRAKLSLGKPTLINPQLPQGTRVTIVEDLNAANATAAPGVKWQKPKWSPTEPREAGKFTITEDGSKVSFVIENQANLRLNLANTNVIQSTFKVAKKIVGDDAAAYGDQAFSFDYTCSDGQSGTVTGVTANGSPVAVTDGGAPKEFPTGTQCTITEQAPAERPGYTLEQPEPVKVTVQNAIQVATITNKYTRDSGTFALTKVLNAGGSRGFDKFTIHYECSAAGYSITEEGVAVPATGSVEVTAGEETVVGRFPTGTTCEPTTETVQEREGYDLQIDIGEQVTIATGQKAVSQVTNTYTAQTGTFAISKTVVANGSTPAPGEEFLITYTCTPLKRTGLDPVTKTVKVDDGDTVQAGEFPVGTTCVVTEETAPERPGYTLTKTLGEEVTIAKDQESRVQVTNTYERDFAPFAVTKQLNAGGSTGSDSFVLNYECTAPGSDDTDATGQVTVNAGQTVAVGRFPVGTECRVTSEQPAERDGYTLTTQLGGTVTLDVKDEARTVTVTNTYERDHAPFEILKTVVAGGSTGTDSFTVNYTCDAAGKNVAATGSVQVTAGQTKSIGEFPTGTKCRVHDEDVAAAARPGYTLDVSYGPEVTLVKGVTAQASVTNTYTRDFAPFAVEKVLNAGGSTGNDTFVVNYKCDAPGKNNVAAAGQVSVDANQTVTVGQFPTGTKCSITGEQAADRVGYTLTTDVSEEVTVALGAVAKVTVTNTYTRDFTRFEILKSVVPGGSTGGDEFTMQYTCSAEGANGVPATGSVKVTAGQAKPIGEFPTGTKCRVHDEDVAAAARPGYSVEVTYGPEVTLRKGETAQVSVINTYSRDHAPFAVAKELVSGGSTGVDEFGISYECDAPGRNNVAATGKVMVSAGKPTLVGEFPTGTTCKVTSEDPAERDGYTLTTEIGDPVTLDAKDEKKVVTVKNTYVRDYAEFVINKTVDAGGSTGSDTFTMQYTCTAPGADNVPATGTVEVTAGVPKTIGRFPTGTKCRAHDEDLSAAARPGYTLGVNYGEEATLVKGQTAEVSVANAYVRQRGGFVINKTVAGDGAALAPKEFEFTYTCENTPTTVKVKPGVPYGVDGIGTGKCTIKEGAADVPKATLDTKLKINGEASTDGIFEIVDGETVEVAVTNEYSLVRGNFVVTKAVEKDLDSEAFTNHKYGFDFQCSEGTTGSFAIKPGERFESPQLPLDTTCEISERLSEAQVEGYTLTAPAAQKVEIAEGGKSVEVGFVNKYKRDLGFFTVAKNVVGGPFAADKFTFHYACGELVGRLEVTGDGVAVKADAAVPTGTECRLWEDHSSAKRAGYMVTLPAEQRVKIGDATASAVFTNSYTKVVKPGLPKTGA